MEKNVLIRLNYIIMREILAFVSFLVGLTFISCSSKIEGKDCGVYKVSSEMVYYYEDERHDMIVAGEYYERDDSLVCGLSAINKEKHYYENGECALVLCLLIEDPDIYTDVPFQQRIYLNEDEISKLNVFLDSCLSNNVTGYEHWEFKMKSGVIFSYKNSHRWVNFWCGQGHCLDLQITPQRLKEVLTKVMEDENLRDDE